MELWLKKVWSKRPGGLLKKTIFISVRSVQGTCNRINKKLATKLKTHLAVIPGGLTSQLQPLDISVNKLKNLALAMH